MKKTILVKLAVLLIVTTSAHAVTRLVPGEYATIQAAIDDCNDGDVVIVAPGTYTGDGNRDIDFKGKEITVRSTDPNDPNIVAATIIDCNGTEAEPHRGFYFNSDGDKDFILDGLTIANGHSNFVGGGIYCRRSNLIISNCRFVGNSAWSDGGGGLYNNRGNITLTNCAFVGNSSKFHDGGGLCNHSGNITLTNCTFVGNSARSGGGLHNEYCDITLANCAFVGNTAEDYGGGCVSSNVSNISLVNCTFVANSAKDGNALACSCNAEYGGYCEPGDAELSNCILWGGGHEVYEREIPEEPVWDGGHEVYEREIPEESNVTITFSNIQGGWPGEGNIDADPFFVDPDGNDYRLRYGSPCINAGDNSAIPPSVLVDLDGNPRIVNGIVDMGAYEFGRNWYVDAINGNDNNDGLSRETAFATIQKGIDSASDGDAVLVYPGLYAEEINFLGKAITVQSAEGAAVLEAPDEFAVSFCMGEGHDSVLKNFVIRNNFLAVLIDGSSPTISNVTVVDNMFGITAYGQAQPDISNSIFWNNIYGDLFGCQARYSCTEDAGESNLDIDPLFADPDNGNYHLLSERGRYWPEHDIWVLDKVTSPCIDGGDPTDNYSNEPMPNGGRINMGAYGGTAYASMKELRCNASDINHDGWINMTDFSMLAENWLKYEPPTSNIPPVAGIIEPQDGAEFNPYEPIQIEAYAWDVDGLVRIVEFFADGTEIGGDDDGSDGWKTVWADWAEPPRGTHSISIDAKATDDDGAVTTSSPIEIRVESKGRPCFPADTGVWVDGKLVQISTVAAGQKVGKVDFACTVTACLEQPTVLKQIECVQEHDGVFECHDIVLENGNCISVVGSHLFLVDSGRWFQVQKLRSDMRLQSMNGTIGIESVVKRPLPYIGKVYNLKVKEGERYLVGKDGIIVRDY